jgi:hypothetical protein
MSFYNKKLIKIIFDQLILTNCFYKIVCIMKSYFECLSYDMVEIIYNMLDNFNDKDNFVLSYEYLTILLACKLIKDKNKHTIDRKKFAIIDKNALHVGKRYIRSKIMFII